MKEVFKYAVLVVASVVLAGTARAQDQSASFDQRMQANFAANITLELKQEPQLVLGTSTRITGLIVDCAQPRQMLAMLNPSSPARNLPKPLPPSLLPVKAPRAFNGDLAVHDADFTLIRLSFP